MVDQAVLDQLVEQVNRWLGDDQTVAMMCVVGVVLIVARYCFLWRRRQANGKASAWSLSTPIFWWSRTEALTLGELFEGVFIGGGTGSGKTTGSGRAIREGLMRAGAGGIVFTVKPDDPELFVDCARKTGRLNDLIMFGPGHGYNFIREESRRCGTDLVENTADLLAIGGEIVERGGTQGGSGQEEGYFWKNARQQLLRNAIVPLNIAYGGTSVPDLFAFVSSLPTSVKEGQSKQWRKSSFCFKTFAEAERRCRPEQETDLAMSYTYLTRQLPASGDRTMGNVVMTLTSMADIMVRGLARRMLCSETTVTPEMMEQGKVIVFAIPIAQYGITGRLIQGIIRYCFQRAMLRRDVRKSPRPVFFWADEAQYLASSFDLTFLSTCRASRVANVYLTQTLPGMYSALGGLHKGKAEADGIISNLNLKIMHATTCPATAEFASQSIGMSRQLFFSANNSYEPTDVMSSVFGLGGGPTTSAGFNEQLQYDVQPAEFMQLLNGGPKNNWRVEGIAYRSGRVFSDTGRNWRRVTFNQKN